MRTSWGELLGSRLNGFSRQGTLSLGAFRGVHQGSRCGQLHTRAFVCEPANYPTDSINQRLPLLALVDFSDEFKSSEIGVAARNSHPLSFRIVNSASRRLRGLQSFEQGQHAVVLLERMANGDLLVADPAIGKVRWSDDYFRNIWLGEGIYLVAK